MHLSSEKEIRELVETTTSILLILLKKFRQRLPRVVTIARSTEDEYTPTNQVELIQDSVTMAIKRVYHYRDNTCVTLKYDYMTRSSKNSHNWVYETPADICDCTYL